MGLHYYSVSLIILELRPSIGFIIMVGGGILHLLGIVGAVASSLRLYEEVRGYNPTPSY